MRDKSSGINTPFENLESKLSEKSVALNPCPAERIFLEKTGNRLSNQPVRQNVQDHADHDRPAQ